MVTNLLLQLQTVQAVDNCLTYNPCSLARKTTTTISVDEITQVLDKGRKLLADLAIAGGYADLYKMQDEGKCLRKLLYLYLYAIESWDTTKDALNYYDQKDLIRLLSQVEQLFYIVNTQHPCNDLAT